MNGDYSACRPAFGSASGVVNTAEPRACPLRKRSKAEFASLSGDVRKNVRRGTFGAIFVQSSASFLVRFATEQSVRSTHGRSYPNSGLSLIWYPPQTPRP